MTEWDPSATFEGRDARAQALRRAVRALEAAGIAEARSDARVLVLHTLALSPSELALRPDVAIGESGAQALDAAVRRRLAGEPVARILGEWEFWGLPFLLSSETLVPRPDTETLVETALTLLPDRREPRRLLDLGTGSGCILVALLAERPTALGIGVDRSPGACATARRNAARNGVGPRALFLNGNWCDALGGSFDLIVSNPPYIADAAIAGLSVEVRCHDPRAALEGGGDGLDAYRVIFGQVAAAPNLLGARGALVVEIGHDQAEAVSRLGTEAGFVGIDLREDLAGNKRVVTLRPPFDVTA